MNNRIVQKIKVVLILVKNHWLIVFGIFLCLLIVFSAVLRLITPQNNVVIPSIPQPVTKTVKQTDFSGAEITLTATPSAFLANLPVFATQTTAVSLSQLAQNFNLQPTDQADTWQSADKSSYLSQDIYSKRLSYSNFHYLGDSDPALQKIVNKDDAIRTAANFVQNQLHLNNLAPDPNKINYLATGYEVYPTTSDQANIVEISFAYQVNGMNVYSDNDLFAPLVVSVDSTNKVVSFSMSENMITSATQISRVITLPIEEIRNEILAGNVGLIQIVSSTSDGFQIKNLKSLTIDSVQLEYRLSSGSNQIIPYYRLHGVAANLQGSVSKLELITPAVVTNQNSQ
jgi:hypothetical protein